MPNERIPCFTRLMAEFIQYCSLLRFKGGVNVVDAHVAHFRYSGECIDINALATISISQ